VCLFCVKIVYPTLQMLVVVVVCIHERYMFSRRTAVWQYHAMYCSASRCKNRLDNVWSDQEVVYNYKVHLGSDKLWKSIIMPLEKPGKLGEFFSLT